MRSAEARIPVIDLFAGPGGLGEGFSRYPLGGDPRFKVCLSIEKDRTACATLELRAFFRHFAPGPVPEAYYAYLRGEITRKRLFDFDPECRLAAAAAKEEARMIELGDDDKNKPDTAKRKMVRALIDRRVAGVDKWVLTGGPPCQAYSLAGRSRMLGVVRKDGESERAFQARKERVKLEFEADHRHFLYREYLSIIADHWPPLFVMENVKGLLSAKANGRKMFPVIREDLSDPSRALGLKGRGKRYRIFSIAVAPTDLLGEPEDSDFLIHAERHGVPQKRQRVILLGIRTDLEIGGVPILERSETPSLRALFNGLPKLSSGVTDLDGMGLREVVSRIGDSPWLQELTEHSQRRTKAEMKRVRSRIEGIMSDTDAIPEDSGGEFIPKSKMKAVPGKLGEWLHDSRLRGVCNHSARSHMESDLHRYLFCSAFAAELAESPKLRDFPEPLLPAHKNVEGEKRDLRKFADRFRVQLYDGHSSTLTSHISHDGHHFIHPDPAQVRSFTVREAARVQTFPDNYFFEGPVTKQFHQVGNAVPPFLAHQIAGIVARVLGVQ